jgi:hypothetical protein
MIDFDLDVVSKLLVPIGQLAVAIAVGLISFSQWRTANEQKEIARQKILLDLFDRRFKIYETVVRIFPTAQFSKFDEKFDNEFKEGTRGDQFLFDKKIHDVNNKIKDIIWSSQSQGRYVINHNEITPLVEEFKKLAQPYLRLDKIKGTRR